METMTPIEMPGTPKPWMNRAMMVMLRTPGLRRVVGRMFAIITVTGARTGTRYSTPVQAFSEGGRYLVLSQRHRIWWRNIRTQPEVELVVRGHRIAGHGRIAEGDEARDLITRVIEEYPRIAKFYGIELAVDGAPDPGGVAALDDAAVVIVVET